MIVLWILLGILIGALLGYWLPPHGHLPRRDRPRPVRSILLPFSGESISRRAFDAAVRLAKAEDAIIIPAFLIIVPPELSLEAALPTRCTEGMGVLEAIEQRAVSQGVQVESRVMRGRSYRHALQRLLEEEPFDRIIVSADDLHGGLKTDDVNWLLAKVPTEVLVLRPAPEDERRVSAQGFVGKAH